MTKTVTIVGAAIGGLSLAVRLARQGFSVSLFEKHQEPGGRCGRLQAGGYTFDIGPTILLMPDVVKETFTAVGAKVADYLTLERITPNYRIRFSDDSALTLDPDREALKRNIEAVMPGQTRHLDAFLELSRTQHDIAMREFVGRSFSGVADFLRLDVFRALSKTRALRSLHSVAAQHFTDPRLVQALTFQTMYLGLSPFSAPAIYGLLAHTELDIGIYYPRGGMHALPRALDRLASELGVRRHYGVAVKKVVRDGTRATGLLLDDGTHVRADIVVCNADLSWAYDHLLDVPAPRRLQRMHHTSSAVMFYFGVDRRCPELQHHNVFFDGDYKSGFADIFKHGRVPGAPSFYVAAPSRSDAALAPAGHEAIYVLVPVPNTSFGTDFSKEVAPLRAKVLQRLARYGLADLERHIQVERVITPNDWQQGFNLAHGSIFGLSQGVTQIGPFRPQHRDPRLDNLYFVGASTQPGTGIPTVMISARLAAERIVAEHGASDPQRLFALEDAA
ncbi:MAG: phytoene desaturase [Deltaproteobacteria bacterium]|nr:phytoene desaturase [Deltaproteobacteria bacterium]